MDQAHAGTAHTQHVTAASKGSTFVHGQISKAGAVTLRQICCPDEAVLFQLKQQPRAASRSRGSFMTPNGVIFLFYLFFS